MDEDVKDVKKLKRIVKKKKIMPWSKNPIFEIMRDCDKCPLGAKTVIKVVNDKEFKISIPAKCMQYKPSEKCKVSYKQFLDNVKMYFELGEMNDTIELQKALIFQVLADANMARETEIFEKRRPGFYTHKNMELALKSLEALNKLKYGELNKNININVDSPEALIEAYKKSRDEQPNPNEKIIIDVNNEE